MQHCCGQRQHQLISGSPKDLQIGSHAIGQHTTQHNKGKEKAKKSQKKKKTINNGHVDFEISPGYARDLDDSEIVACITPNTSHPLSPSI
jgi:hypothetical protein